MLDPIILIKKTKNQKLKISLIEDPFDMQVYYSEFFIQFFQSELFAFELSMSTIIELFLFNKQDTLFC